MGILLIVTILISGSAVAAWYYGFEIYDYNNVTNQDAILDAPDKAHATLGQTGSPNVLGYIIVDLGAGNGVPPDHHFTVFANFTGETEEYTVSMSEDLSIDIFVGEDDDSGDHDFTSPSSGTSWRYIILVGKTGITSISDPIYGPEIDAVGWQD